MRIAIFHELHAGGARRAVNEFSKEFKKNHVVDLYITDERVNKQEEKNFTNIFTYAFISQKWSGRNWKVRLYKDTIELYKLYLLHKKIGSIINNSQYDIVIVYPSQYTQAPFILRFLKIKTIYYCMEPLRLVYDPVVKVSQNLDIFRSAYEMLNKALRKIIDWQNVNTIKLCIAPSKYLAKLFANIYKKPVKTIYCGVDTNFFQETSLKKDIDLLYVGSLDPVDGHALFEQIVRNTSRKITVKKIMFEEGWLTDKQMRDLFRRSKILVATSHNEPLGLVPLEAMSCGAVVVAIAEGGYKETVVNGKNGYLLPRDAKKIAQKIEWLLSHKSILTKLSKNGKNIMNEKWTWKRCAEELEVLFKHYYRSN